MSDPIDVSTTISKLQFHYWFSDKSHTMDALVYNKCEREILELAKVVAKLCGVTIKMDTEPSGKGGLKSWLTLTAKSPKKIPASKVAMLNLLVASSVATPHHDSIGKIAYLLFDRLLLEKEFSEGEQWRQMINEIKEEAEDIIPLLDRNSVVKKRRSNFYDLLRKYPKIKSISVALIDNAKKIIAEEQFVVRDDFKKFIVSSNTVEPQLIENAQIEIISPVLVTGRHKWKGIYNGDAISFVMKSDYFMVLVQSGKVEFKSGSGINCTLEIEKKVNAVGVERVINYNILEVASYSENGKTLEAVEVKSKQKQNVISKRQLDLFG